MRLRFAALLLSSIFVGLSAGQVQTNNTDLNAQALFEKGMNALEGSSATRSGPNATEYFRRSAELGFAPAQVVLGYFYETGRNLTADPQLAADWYKKAARQDDPLAQWLLGRLIYMGTPARDLNEAASWLEKSEAHDDAFAQYLLGKIFMERGDYARAAVLLEKSALHGLPQAQRHLAILLRDGKGLPRDKTEAYVWMTAGYDAGQRSVASDLQGLESELSSSQLEQAKSRARDLEAKTARTVTAQGCTGWPGEFDEIPSPPPPDLQHFCR